jgi:acetyltransferase-like isoleucine patch superfamily enzyme
MRLPRIRPRLRVALCCLAVVAPRRLRPRILNLVPSFRVHPTSSIGVSFLCPTSTLIIGPHARVGHFNMARQVNRLELGAHSQIGNLNSISGVVQSPGDPYWDTAREREPEFVLGERAAVTNRHYFDCADSIRLGEGCLVAGLRTIILTHGVNIASGEQRCDPVQIGRCCMVSTTCVILKGSVLPDFCVLAPLSVLRTAHTEKHRLYSGNPAVAVHALDPDAGFFRNAMRLINE